MGEKILNCGLSFLKHVDVISLKNSSNDRDNKLIKPIHQKRCIFECWDHFSSHNMTSIIHFKTDSILQPLLKTTRFLIRLQFFLWKLKEF